MSMSQPWTWSIHLKRTRKNLHSWIHKQTLLKSLPLPQEVKEEEELVAEPAEEAEEVEEEEQDQIQAIKAQKDLFSPGTCKTESTTIIDRHKMEPFISPYMATLYVIIGGYRATKGKNCTIKATDREAGLTRIYHPDRDKAVSNHEKAKFATAAAAR
jgi:hypothetical protein